MTSAHNYKSLIDTDAMFRWREVESIYIVFEKAYFEGAVSSILSQAHSLIDTVHAGGCVFILKAVEDYFFVVDRVLTRCLQCYSHVVTHSMYSAVVEDLDPTSDKNTMGHHSGESSCMSMYAILSDKQLFHSIVCPLYATMHDEDTSTTEGATSSMIEEAHDAGTQLAGSVGVDLALQTLSLAGSVAGVAGTIL
jgi:hypothetical protein